MLQRQRRIVDDHKYRLKAICSQRGICPLRDKVTETSRSETAPVERHCTALRQNAHGTRVERDRAGECHRGRDLRPNTNSLRNVAGGYSNIQRPASGNLGSVLHIERDAWTCRCAWRRQLDAQRSVQLQLRQRASGRSNERNALLIGGFCRTEDRHVCLRIDGELRHGLRGVRRLDQHSSPVVLVRTRLLYRLVSVDGEHKCGWLRIADHNGAHIAAISVIVISVIAGG
ncbi:hypothetical protein B0G57_11741 [Trinickia symbiotica]|nr:hypothetical protein B0G57_11741 [Trinickia symbiotica]